MDPAFRPARRIAEEGYGIPRPSTPTDLWLNGNEGRAPDAELLHTLIDAGPEILRRYPEAEELESVLADRHGVPRENLMVTAGADEALDRICRAILEPGREMVLPAPTFEMFEISAKLNGGTLVEVPWVDGRCPVDEMLKRINDSTAAVGIVTPNNPTGLVAYPDDLQRLSAGIRHGLLIVDLAYSEFADVDLMPTVLALPNAVALRTLSKAWGLAGLRVGYVVGPPRLIQWLKRAGGPYPVAQISRFLARRRLETGAEQVRDFVERTRTERQNLFSLLEELGATPAASQANFVFARLSDAAGTAAGLAGMGIAVRAFPGRAHCENALRITCPGNAKDYQRLEHALRTVLSPQALLLDMDGVLADVSGSYRKAIVETADTFGVQVTHEQITNAKTQGNANNDWELTLRLLTQAGVQASFEDVKDRFESLYQGTETQPGLWQTETLLCPIELLRSLSETLPLGIVTGRPRADTLRFLEQHGISSFFSTLVCLEDGPTKPDPTPVRLAMQRLGIERAWFVGDTPDDISAARAANVLPIGIPGPMDAAGDMRRVLLDTGAGHVIDSLNELLTIKQRGKNRQVET